MRLVYVLAIMLCGSFCTALSAEDTASLTALPIKGGEFTPLYGLGSQQKKVRVKSFRIDKHPITKSQYALFLDKNPDWNKNTISKIMGDARYLEDWNCDENSCSFQKGAEQSPVTFISWFAAQAYCSWVGGKLPTTHQWEFVAAASESKPDAQRDPEFVNQLLALYGRPLPAGSLPNVMQGKANFYGVYDMHDLAWEWTDDFNSVFVAGDNRREQEAMKNLFCGAGALSASDRANYAAYMRYAMRSSLKGSFALKNVGFRCSYEAMKSK